jgi:hypothetical protein
VTTKAAAKRWLERHAGRRIDTLQVRPSGMTWEPDTRTLSVYGGVYRLDDSRVTLDKDTVVLEADTRLVLERHDGDGVTIHVTTYTVADVLDEDDEDDE